MIYCIVLFNSVVFHVQFPTDYVITSTSTSFVILHPHPANVFVNISNIGIMVSTYRRKFLSFLAVLTAVFIDYSRSRETKTQQSSVLFVYSKLCGDTLRNIESSWSNIVQVNLFVLCHPLASQSLIAQIISSDMQCDQNLKFTRR